MEIYILSKEDLSILSITKLIDYQINLDEETNAVSNFTLLKTDGLLQGNFLIININCLNSPFIIKKLP